MSMPAHRFAASEPRVRLRSLLFVPGDRPDRMAKALSLEADALILDLEDAVTPARKDEARTAIAEVLAAPVSYTHLTLPKIYSV